MKNFIAFISIILLIALSSCQDANNPTSSPPPSTVPFSLKIAMAGAPVNVATIIGNLERDGYNPIVKQFIIAGDTAVADFGDVHAGLWHLSVTAYDSSFSPIYFGETDVNVIAGITNTVFLQLDPLTGSLVVVVTWNNPNLPGNNFVYMHTHDYLPKVIYRFNVQTSLLEQMTFENQTCYPIYLKNINKIGYSNGSFGEFWIMDPDGQSKMPFFTYPTPNFNHQSYSEGSNKIYFYSIESTRRLAVVDYDGQNFQYLTEANNNAYPEINSAGDSLLFHSDRTGVNNIYLLDLNTMSERQITFNSDKSWRPRWSTHKAGFYFHKTASSGHASIMFYDFHSGLSEAIIILNDLYIHSYGFSPDETRFALICSNSPSYTSYPQNLYIYDLVNSTLTQKTFANLLLTKPRWYQINN